MGTQIISIYASHFELHAVVAEASEDFADAWKVLIYDSDCRDIISPLMNIGALRQKGVTLHMLVR